MKETNTILALVAALVMSACLNVYLAFIRPADVVEHTKTEYITERDTIVETRYDTKTVYVPRTEYRQIVVRDTAWVMDSLRAYRDSTDRYVLDVNAVRMDSYRLQIHSKDTIKVPEYHTVETFVKQKKSPFGVGVFAGMGYDPVNKTFGPQVGVGVTFNLTK